MSKENAPASKPEAEEHTNAGDVREAIERAKEVSPDDRRDEVSPAAATTPNTAPERLNQGHESVNTEPYVIQQTESMPSAAAEPLGDAPAGSTVTSGAVRANADTATHGAGKQTLADGIPPVAAPAVAEPSTTNDPSKISIDADHPMAALYIQQPMPPTMVGNRLGGVLIGLLATLTFALVYAGLLALWQAPQFPPSTFLQDGVLPLLTSLGFVLPIGGFFVALVLLVLIVNRAGWWAYVLGGLLVAVIVLVAAAIGYALSPQLTGQDFGISLGRLVDLSTTIPVLAAAVAAREVTVWFGAWIGSRGRKVKAKNALAMREYEAKLAEVQAKLS